MNTANDTRCEPRHVLTYWFEEGMEKHWFRATPALDAAIRQRFEGVWQAAADGHLSGWEDSPEGSLALVIVLDQFPLNMFRGTPKAFSTERDAVRVTRRAVERGHDRAFEGARKAFLYMPLMHSEDLADQDESVRLYQAAGLADNLRFAKHHRTLIRRFGRFPHRNRILGRESNDEENAYLASDTAFKG